MQLRTDTNISRQNFTGIKMTTAHRTDTAKLLYEYIKSPSVENRNKIFEIMDPYMQRQARKIASEGYYYDDVLQNMRLNLFSVLEDECYGVKPNKPSTEAVKKLKFKLFHNVDNTIDAKIPQKDETLVPWHKLSNKVKETLIPPDRLERQKLAEDVDYFINESNLIKFEKMILDDYVKKDLKLSEIADLYNLTRERIRQIKERSIKRICMQHGIEKPSKELQV